MKKQKQREKNHVTKHEKHNEIDELSNGIRNTISTYGVLIFASVVSLYIGIKYAGYVKQLHENDMWFSSIKQVEREISFRTECGLYYSYYKQMVLASSISQGWYELTHDNKTESLRTINIVERFNIYQEVVLGIIYRVLPNSMKPSEYVYLYLDAIYGSQCILMMSLFFSAYFMSGTFVAGILANTFFILNRPYLTRIHKSAPLRESTALPFIFLQIAAMTFYLKKSTTKSQRVNVTFYRKKGTSQEVDVKNQNVSFYIMCGATFVYTLIWQFAQFVMLLQAFALFALYVLGFVKPKLLRPIFWMKLCNLLVVCILMFGNDMLYSALVFCFSIATLILLYIEKDDEESIEPEKEEKSEENKEEVIDKKENMMTYMKRFGLAILKIITVFILTFIISSAIKKTMGVESDDHVYKFVQAKLGIGDALNTRDFDARMYICNEAFRYMTWRGVEGLIQGVLFPVYVICFALLFLVLVYCYFTRTLRGLPSLLDDYPELVYHLLLSVFFGGMTITTIRMKYLWFPMMTILAAGIASHVDAWTYLLKKTRLDKTMSLLVRYSIPGIIIAMVFYQKLTPIQTELGRLLMFKDADTVELMEWITNNTEPHEAFSGTMQLMAGVKLCTDRPITNHPHYENKFLRERTRDIYQMYGKTEPKEVNRLLHVHGSNYIVLENSICYSRNRYPGCHQKDIMDLANGHEVDEKKPRPRFCHAIKLGLKEFEKYFKKVFENKTFHLYKVLDV